MLKLSQTSKLGCKSWSLQAGETCPGSIRNGQPVPACQMCYAKTGNYRFANVRNVRDHNKLDWLRPEWEDDMVKALTGETHFRWLDSGDLYSLALARKVYNVMKRTPWCDHWLPTRMWKFAKFRIILDAMQSLPNVVVRYSSDSVLGETLPGTGSTIIPHADFPTEAFVCGAYQRNGQCGSCRQCWNKSTPTIAYVAHGRSAAKVIRIASH